MASSDNDGHVDDMKTIPHTHAWPEIAGGTQHVQRKPRHTAGALELPACGDNCTCTFNVPDLHAFAAPKPMWPTTASVTTIVRDSRPSAATLQ